MSRIGQKPIKIPTDVIVDISAGAVTVKGKKGELNIPLHDSVSIKTEEGSLNVSQKEIQKLHDL